MAKLALHTNLPASLGAASADLQEVLGPFLKDYLDYARHTSRRRTAKVLNDAVWHTVRIEPWEVVILDSPVLQRLRNIKQLGMAAFVFPSAGYSRFEHSIGVVNQAQRVIESINRNARASAAQKQLPAEDPVTPHEEALVRISALLHDAGHGFLSHVSERAISRIGVGAKANPVEIVREAKQYFVCRKTPPVAEVIAALIVLLPEFVEILDFAAIPYSSDARSFAAEIATLIVGGQKFPTRPFLNEIISGAVDADKLDYLPRDCYMAGLPMPVDVERLLQKMHLVRVAARDLPGEYAKAHNIPESDPIHVLAVDPSGGRTVEELVISRLLLYEKLYQHQKVRALEGMVENALDLLVSAHPHFRNISTYLSLDDSSFLAGKWPLTATGEDSAIRAARELLTEISNRRSFVRAFAFGPSLMESPDPNEKKQEAMARQSWATLVPLVSRTRSSATSTFRQKLVRIAKSYLSALGQAGLSGELSEHHVVIDLPEVQGIAEKTKFFVGDDASGIQSYNELFRVERWAEAYENQKSLGYVFCPPRFAPVIHLAFRDLVLKTAGLQFDSRSWRMTKLAPEELANMAETLISRKIKTTSVIVPEKRLARREYLTNISSKVDVLNRYSSVIRDLAARCQTFQSDEAGHFIEDRIRDWLLQFSIGDLPLTIKALEHIRYWDRGALVNAYSSAIGVLRLNEIETQWAPLGGATASGHHLSYLLQDVKSEFPKIRMSVLGTAEELRPGPDIVLYDDNIGSGGQSRTVLQQWLNKPKREWIVNEHHVMPLSPNAIRILKKSRVTFLFATGRRNGARELVIHAKQLFGHKKFSDYVVEPTDFSCFEPAAKVFTDSKGAAAAKTIFEGAGRMALAARAGEWGHKKISDRLLGYGNVSGLTVFYYNVPTTTLTALWQNSPDSEPPWKALFPRRTRPPT